MKKRSLRIAGVSDVAVGYGSPQIPAFLRSLMEHYSVESGYLFEPDQPERPPRHGLFPHLRIARVETRAEAYSGPGWIEYNARVARELERLAPDVLVLFSPPTLPALWGLRRKPALTIYYVLESTGPYTGHASPFGRLLGDMHRHAAPKLDLLVFPEENRAAIDVSTAGMQGVPLAVVYNAVKPALPAADPLPPAQRIPRLLYSGLIERGATLAEYFVDRDIRPFPVDLCGPIGGAGAAKLRAELESGQGGIRYRGLVDSAELRAMRPRYAYSIVMWAPTIGNQRYACPNKFFEAVADGVPPIVAPHPQCKMLVERYGCGLVMDDWSLPAFAAALREAMDLSPTAAYARMVADCRRAVAAELNWDAQFAKVRRLLPQAA